MIRLKYTIALNYEVIEASDFIFNICAVNSQRQTVVSERLDLDVPAEPLRTEEDVYGNRHVRLHAEKGPLNVRYAATLDIEPHFADPATIAEMSIEQLPGDVLPYIYPSRYCQSDVLSSAVLSQFGQLPRGYARIEAVRQWVQSRTTFMPGSTVSTTSAVDTYVQQRGVCRDFAHLMIAACRALSVPARIVTGLDYGADPALGPPDLHAYTEVFLGNRWYIFDPTGMTIPMGLPRIGTGRDAADVSFATIFGCASGGTPTVTIEALADGREGLVMPHQTGLALSTADDWRAAKPASPPLSTVPALNIMAGARGGQQTASVAAPAQLMF